MSSVYKLDISDDNGRKSFILSGDLVINHIDKIHQEVLAALDPICDVSIVLDNPDNLDMTVIQLVFSIRNTCLAAGKAFDVKSTLKDDIKDLIRKSGFASDLNVQ